jgi:hypothetical protein
MSYLEAADHAGIHVRQGVAPMFRLWHRWLGPQ